MIPNDNNIQAYFHCGKCLNELPEGESPASYARYSAGWTDIGFQLWCERHDCNIIHMNFEGQKHPANTSVPRKGIVR